MKKLLSFASLVFPLSVFAQVTDIWSAEGFIYDLFTKISYLLWALTVMFFFWGVVKFINNSADSKERQEGKQFIIWGLISFVVLVSLWGIVSWLVYGIPTVDEINFIDKSGAPV